MANPEIRLLETSTRHNIGSTTSSYQEIVLENHDLESFSQALRSSSYSVGMLASRAVSGADNACGVVKKTRISPFCCLVLTVNRDITIVRRRWIVAEIWLQPVE